MRLISKRVLFLVALAVLAAAGVAYTFTQAVAFSAFAAALLKVALILVLWEALDRWVLEGIDTIDELNEGNVAVAIALVALAILLAPAIATGQPADHEGNPTVVDTAEHYVGVMETPPGSNEGPAVERFLASVNLSGGYPWCAAFTSYVLDRADAEEPDVRSAVATDFLEGEKVLRAKSVLRTGGEVPPGALSVHRRGSTWKGHIGIVTGDDRQWIRHTTYWEGRCGRTIEGNTSPGDAGPQRDGDGVWRRVRCIRPGSYFRIVAFTLTR